MKNDLSFKLTAVVILAGVILCLINPAPAAGKSARLSAVTAAPVVALPAEHAE